MKSEYIEDVTLANLKKSLIEKAKEKELSHEQKQAYEHSKKFAELSPSQSEKLKEKLIKDFELNEYLATKITDILPNKKELEILVEKEKDFDSEKIDGIIELVNKYKKEE